MSLSVFLKKIYGLLIVSVSIDTTSPTIKLSANMPPAIYYRSTVWFPFPEVSFKKKTGRTNFKNYHFKTFRAKGTKSRTFTRSTIYTANGLHNDVSKLCQTMNRDFIHRTISIFSVNYIQLYSGYSILELLIPFQRYNQDYN